MAGPLSVEPLRWLVANVQAPLQVVVPAHLLGVIPDGRELPVARPALTCADAARTAGIDVTGVSREWQERLAESGAEVLLSACWPWRLPQVVLDAFPAGAFNLHPSLLPRFRGPAPLFWQLRAGEHRTGITLHRLAGNLDSGDIVSQAEYTMDEDDTEDSLAQALGAMSGAVLAPWWNGFAGGIEARPQDPTQASYQPMPSGGDFTVPSSWPARRAYRFMRGTAARGHPFQVDLGARHIRVREALDYRVPFPMDRAVEATARGLRVRFQDGAVEVRPY